MQCERCGCEDMVVLEYEQNVTVYECEACGEVMEFEHISDIAFDAADEGYFG